MSAEDAAEISPLKKPASRWFRALLLFVLIGIATTFGVRYYINSLPYEWRPGLGAEKELAEPESETLFSYAPRSVDEQARRKRIGFPCT